MTSSKASTLVAALCSLIILTSFIDDTQSAWCCLNYVPPRHMSCQRFLRYSIQNGTRSCDIKAVIFHTQRRFLCADPSLHSTKRIMKCIDERNRRIAQILE